MGWNGPNCASFWILDVKSNNFSHAEKKRAACKASEQIHKMTTIFTKNGPRLLFWEKIVVILWTCSALQAVLFSQLEKNHVTQLPAAQT